MAGVVPIFVWPAVCFDLALVFVHKNWQKLEKALERMV